jgi:hypothetical protein
MLTDQAYQRPRPGLALEGLWLSKGQIRQSTADTSAVSGIATLCDVVFDARSLMSSSRSSVSRAMDALPPLNSVDYADYGASKPFWSHSSHSHSRLGRECEWLEWLK